MQAPHLPAVLWVPGTGAGPGRDSSPTWQLNTRRLVRALTIAMGDDWRRSLTRKALRVQ